MPQLGLIEDLSKEPIPAGYALLVEFDPSSDWFTASIAIGAGWARSGGEVSYNAHAQPPMNVRSQLQRLGLDVAGLEGRNKVRFTDWYSATIGQKSKEKRAQQSMKVADLSIHFAKDQIVGPPRPDTLIIDDTLSQGTRFNDEKSWFEFLLTRVIPMTSTRKMTKIFGLTVGVHSQWAYKSLETVVDGIIDFKLDESENLPRNMMRIRRLREVSYDPSWHALAKTPTFEIVLKDRN